MGLSTCGRAIDARLQAIREKFDANQYRTSDPYIVAPLVLACSVNTLVQFVNSPDEPVDTSRVAE